MRPAAMLLSVMALGMAQASAAPEASGGCERLRKVYADQYSKALTETKGWVRQREALYKRQLEQVRSVVKLLQSTAQRYQTWHQLMTEAGSSDQASLKQKIRGLRVSHQLALLPGLRAAGLAPWNAAVDTKSEGSRFSYSEITNANYPCGSVEHQRLPGDEYGYCQRLSRSDWGWGPVYAPREVLTFWVSETSPGTTSTLQQSVAACLDQHHFPLSPIGHWEQHLSCVSADVATGFLIEGKDVYDAVIEPAKRLQAGAEESLAYYKKRTQGGTEGYYAQVFSALNEQIQLAKGQIGQAEAARMLMADKSADDYFKRVAKPEELAACN